MKTYRLKEFTKLHSQSVAAQVIGCTQGNVSHMIAAGRKVFITEDDEGSRSFYEIKGTADESSIFLKNVST